MKKTCTAIFCVFISLVSCAQSISFKSFDLNTGSASSYPGNFCEYNGKLLFAATTATHGRELWISDGTTAGTKLLKDINPGGGDSDPANFTFYNGKMYFAADDGVTGSELWVTDGTETGTKLVIDIATGMASSSPEAGVVYNGKLYFAAEDGFIGTELRSTDGTAAGTTYVKDIKPNNGLGSDPRQLTVYNGNLYFLADDGAIGSELWVTNGTSAGTFLFKDINSGANGSNVQKIYTFYSKLYFRARDANGHELFTCNGLSANTIKIKDVNPGVADGVLNDELIFFAGKVWFSGNDNIAGAELWATDGTAAGTNLVKDIYANMSGSSPEHFTVYNNRLYFYAIDGLSGGEVWSTDGTTAGTTMLKDIASGTTHSAAGNLFEYASKLYFTAQSSAGNKQLYTCDGTSAGTVIIKPNGASATGGPLNNANEFFKFNGSVYFAANYYSMGTELWSITDPSLSAHSFHTQSSFALYPNPNDGSFTIQLDNQNFEKGSVGVYDVMGREVYKSKITNSKSQITLNQPKGIYMVKLQLDDAVMTKRVVVE